LGEGGTFSVWSDTDGQSQSPDNLRQVTTSIYQPAIRFGHREEKEN